MASTSVWVSCPEGTQLWMYDAASGVYVSSGFWAGSSGGAIHVGYCGTGPGNAGAVAGMTGQFNAIAMKTPDPQIAFDDGMLLGWGVAAAMAGAWAVVSLKRALYR